MGCLSLLLCDLEYPYGRRGLLQWGGIIVRFWIRKNDKVSLLPMTGGMALGVVPGLAYKEQSLKLEAGRQLVPLYGWNQ